MLSAEPEGPSGSSPTFFGFIYIHAAVPMPKKLVAYRIWRPERPPAGKIACPTKGQSPAGELRSPDKLKHVPHKSHLLHPKGHELAGG